MTMRKTALVLGMWFALLASALSASAQDLGPSILVRGHWVMEVSNPDGTSVARREFDNHLDPVSGFIFLCIFTRECALGAYSIELSTGSASGYPSPFGNNGGDDHHQPVSRIISESSHNGPIPPGTLEHPVSDNQGGFLLTGSTTALVAGWVTDVSTRFSSCNTAPNQPNGTVAPSDCPTATKNFDLRLTTKSVAPLHLEPGQVVTVKVNISFASATPPALVF